MVSVPESMSDISERIASRYPREVRLGDTSLQLRLMGASDVDAMVGFARTLPAEDLMYLRVNITDAPVVQQWVEGIQQGRTVTVLALKNDQVVGEGTLLHNATSWTRHLGELRIQVSPSVRRQGLARLLANEIEANRQGVPAPAPHRADDTRPIRSTISVQPSRLPARGGLVGLRDDTRR